MGLFQSSDVLARMVEVASGVEFDTFVEERIAKPLKLVDTAFWVEGTERKHELPNPKLIPQQENTTLDLDVTQRPNGCRVAVAWYRRPMIMPVSA